MATPASARPPLPRWSRWLRNSGLALLAVLALVCLLLPRWIEGWGARLASQALGRELTVSAAHLAPWRLGLTLSLRSIVHAAPLLALLTVTRPLLPLTRLADGCCDIDDLLARLAKRSPEAAKAAPPALALYNIRLTDGELLRLQTGQIDAHLALRFAQAAAQAPQLSLSGEGSFSAEQLRLSGQWVDLSVEPLSPSVQALLPVQLRGILAPGRPKCSWPGHWRPRRQRAPRWRPSRSGCAFKTSAGRRRPGRCR